MVPSLKPPLPAKKKMCSRISKPLRGSACLSSSTEPSRDCMGSLKTAINIKYTQNNSRCIDTIRIKIARLREQSFSLNDGRQGWLYKAVKVPKILKGY